MSESLFDDLDRVISIEAYYVVMFRHPAQGPNGSWRTYRRAETRTQADYAFAEAKRERPTYEFHLATVRKVWEWADDE